VLITAANPDTQQSDQVMARSRTQDPQLLKMGMRTTKNTAKPSVALAAVCTTRMSSGSDVTFVSGGSTASV